MLLDYALLTAPSPLQAGMPATLTLVISNGGSQNVTVTSIVITLPIGSNAKDLTVSPSFQTGKTSGWNLAQSGGVLTLTPAGSGAVGKSPVVVTIANIAVNDAPGTAAIAIDETAAVAGGNATKNSTQIQLAKFPVQFALSDLAATPPQVPFGGSAALMWTGTQADGATYTLQYPGSAPIPVSAVGPYQASNLTIFPAVFTLTVSLTVPGQDQPLTAQKQTTVTETPKLRIVDFTQSKLVLSGADDRLVLSWEVQLATSLTLGLDQLPGSVAVTGQSSCIVSASGSPTIVVSDMAGKQLGTLTPPEPFPQFLTFVLAASDGASFMESRVQVKVLPPQLTEFRYDYTVWYEEGPHYNWYLHWATVNASPVTIQPFGKVNPSGMLDVYYGETYTISAAGFGATVTAQKTIQR
jgi:hypothetical protein